MEIRLVFNSIAEHDQYIHRMAQSPSLTSSTAGSPGVKSKPVNKPTTLPPNETTKPESVEDDLLSGGEEESTQASSIVTSEMITGECSRIVAKMNQEGKQQIRTLLQESGFPGLRSIPEESRANFFAQLQKIGKVEEVTLD